MQNEMTTDRAEELVPLDTDGNEVEVELEESKVTEVIEEEATPEPEAVEEEDSSEHEEYSKKVETRINKLTAKLREAERREEAATTFAKSMQEENKTLKTRTTDLNTNYLTAEAQRITAETERAKNELRLANESSDTEKQTEAQSKIAALAVEAQRITELTKATPETAETEVEVPEAPQQQQEYATPTPDPKAQEWADSNDWFGTDRAMTYTAFEIHKDLTEKEGYDPNSDEYYAEVDKRIRVDFPHKFGNTEQKQPTAPVQTVASANRSVKPGRKQVRLTSSQVAIAKKLGVPLEEYAKQLKNTEGA